MPSQVEATAIGSTNSTASSAPLREALTFFAAKQRVKLSIATKKLMPIETTSARIVAHPHAPKSKKLSGKASESSASPPAWLIATGMPINKTPSSSKKNCTQSV